MSSSEAIRKFENFVFSGQMQFHQGNTPCYSEVLYEQRRRPSPQPVDPKDCITIGYIRTNLDTGEEMFIRTYHPAAFQPKNRILQPRVVYYFDKSVDAMRMRWV